MGFFFKDILLGCKRDSFLNREDAKSAKEEKRKEEERGDRYSYLSNNYRRYCRIYYRGCENKEND